MLSRTSSRSIRIGLGVFFGIFSVYFIFTFLQEDEGSAPFEPRSRSSFSIFPKPVGSNDLYSSWKRCISPKLERLRGNYSRFWEETPYRFLECDKPFVDILKIKNYTNSDESKYHIHPILNSSEPIRVVTMGIGHDTRAEELLLEDVGKGNALFFGADPMVEVNRDLYSKLGKYYPFAVSGRAGYSMASALEGDTYSSKSVVYVDAIYFLTKVIGLRFFDTIWMDAEGGEYELFPLLQKGGGFDKAGVTICQLNMEIHLPNDEQKKSVYDFFFNALDDERYAFFYAVPIGHLRIYMVNLGDKECLDKYIPKEISGYHLL